MALPLLQRRMAPLWAGLVLGAIWEIWHLPAFLLSSTPQSARSLTPFFAGTVALSFIVTPLFNRSRGSIMLPALFHLQLSIPSGRMPSLTIAGCSWRLRPSSCGYTGI